MSLRGPGVLARDRPAAAGRRRFRDVVRRKLDRDGQLDLYYLVGEVTTIYSAAYHNTVYMLAVNRVGEESGFRFIGQSAIADPTGAILARAGVCSEEILYADIDPARARQKRLVRVAGKHEINRFADRRPGFYGPILAPNGRE